MARPGKSGSKGKPAGKARLTPKAMRKIKGGDAKTKVTTTTTATPKAIEITDYGFGVTMPVTSS